LFLVLKSICRPRKNPLKLYYYFTKSDTQIQKAKSEMRAAQASIKKAASFGQRFLIK